MYRIGDFSVLCKTTIKTLRYYEKEGLLIPCYVDNITGYRFYDSSQLLDLSKIISLRQIGMSIDDIKDILNGNDMAKLLQKRSNDLKNQILTCNNQLSRINILMEDKNMKYEAIIKTLPDYIVYYKEGVISEFEEMVSFILQSGEECRKLNPEIKCVNPDYCYVSYLDKEYKDKNIKIRYSQAVTKEGKSNNVIKFEKLKPEQAVCVYHKGSYDKLKEAYGYAIFWLENNNYTIIGPIRERYIDGMWNKENEDEWLTEIQIPVAKTEEINK